MAKRLSVVVDDESLYRAIKIEAARRGVPARKIVAQALEMWLVACEDEDDVAVSLAALDGYRAEGGTSADLVHTEVDRVLAERERPQ